MTMPDTLIQLVNGNYHREPRLRARKVGAAINFAALQADVDRLILSNPYTVVGPGHNTAWVEPTGEARQYSLWNSQGHTDKTNEDFNYILAGKRAPNDCPAIQNFASSLPSLVNMRLNCLMPGASLNPHEEHLPILLPNGEVGTRARFHLPIYTNPQARVLADDVWMRFAEGYVYLFNNGCVHAAENLGTTPRYHIVWDMLMTTAAYSAMFIVGTSEITHLSSPVRRSGPPVEIGDDYARSGGITATEFDSREFAYLP